MGACSNLSGSGPRTPDIVGGATTQLGTPTAVQPRVVYALVTLDNTVVQAVSVAETVQGFSASLVNAGPGPVLLGPGDILGITIFEAQAGGLFVPAETGGRPGNFVTLPLQQIDRSGFISVPFIGPVRAAGQSSPQLEQLIRRRLASRALDPQVLVTLQERRSAAVSVLGDVYLSLRFPLDPGGESLLGAVSRAGGPRFAPHETLVQLQRSGKVEQAMLFDIAANPTQNVQLRAGDVVVVSRLQRYFLALGAVGQAGAVAQLNRRFAFEDRYLSLADAVARAGGLQDDRANPSGVFLYRHERTATLARAGLAVSGTTAAELPTIYRVDLTDPSSYFLAQRFPVRGDDVIFVSNSPASDLEKVLRLVLPLASTGALISTITR